MEQRNFKNEIISRADYTLDGFNSIIVVKDVLAFGSVELWCAVCSKGVSTEAPGWILTKLSRNYPYIVLFIKCLNGSSLLHI